MTDEQLQQLAALTEAATPGPWLVSIVDNVNAAFCRVAPDATAHVCCYTDNRENDIAFISAARDAVPELLAEAAVLRRQLEHANRWRDNEILAANEARAEAADLRRQLAETQATIAALRIATAAYAEIAAICPACGGGGEVNSGRVTPHGDEIYVICPTCQGSGRAYIADTPHRAGKGDMFARGEMVSADAMPDVQPSPHGPGLC